MALIHVTPSIQMGKFRALSFGERWRVTRLVAKGEAPRDPRMAAAAVLRSTRLPEVSRLVLVVGLILLLPIIGCSAASGTGSTMQPQAANGGVQISTCGARGGFEFKLYKVDCEIANTLIVMLDGRALHQSVIFTAEGKRRGAWVCTSPTPSLVDRLHCKQGARFFTVSRSRPGEH